MKKLKKENVVQVRLFLRILAGVVCGLSSISIGIVIFVFINGQFDFLGFLILFPICWLAHLSYSVANSGYPPEYLLWTSSKNKNGGSEQ